MTSDTPNGVCGDVGFAIQAGTVGLDPSWTGGIPRSLLPLPGTTLIEALAEKLCAVGNGTCVVCASGSVEAIAARITANPQLRSCVRFCVDPVPRGAAGCVKSCGPLPSQHTILVVGGSVWLGDDVSWMVAQHRKQGNALTVFCTREPAATGSDRAGLLSPAGAWCCDRCVLDFIPGQGYFDLKEQLCPALLREGLRVGAVVLEGGTCEVCDWETYISVVRHTLLESTLPGQGYSRIAPGTLCGANVHVSPDATIIGPVLIGHGCRVSEGATVIGPTMLGDGCTVGPGSSLVRIVAPQAVEFPSGATVADRLITPPTPGPVSQGDSKSPEPIPQETPDVSEELSSPAAGPSASIRRPFRGAIAETCAASVILVGLFTWAFWHTCIGLWRVWQSSSDHSAGQLVPLAAAYMVVTRRRKIAGLARSFDLRGFGLFGFGLGVNLLGAYYLYSSLENLGVVICANGLAIGLLGWRQYKHLWYPFVFLFLMIPLPNRIHDAVMLPLQGLGARLSAGILEIVGVPASRLGHILEVGGHQLAVAEACNGLRMALAFLIVAGIVAYLVRRPGWQRVIVVISAVPVALVCNTLRIAITACLYTAGYERLAEGSFHQMVGLLMMPVALGLILLELQLLSALAPPTEGPGCAGPSDESLETMSSPGAIA